MIQLLFSTGNMILQLQLNFNGCRLTIVIGLQLENIHTPVHIPSQLVSNVYLTKLKTVENHTDEFSVSTKVLNFIMVCFHILAVKVAKQI